jgi:DNA-binding transcriptional regulator YiaG
MHRKNTTQHPPESTDFSPDRPSELNAGERVKQARIALGMSQSQFARALGIKRRYTISDWERGKKTPKSYIWLAIEQLKSD